MTEAPIGAIPAPELAFDRELAAGYADLWTTPTVRHEDIPAFRAAHGEPDPRSLIHGLRIAMSEYVISSDHGDLSIAVFSPKDAHAKAPALLYIHGGGMILGGRFSGVEPFLEWAHDKLCVVVTVEYRLAPETRYPGQLSDSYSALKWVAGHHEDLSIDPQRIVVAGSSAGGGLAASLALLVRDLGSPSILGQMLLSPMLDYRNDSPSSVQFENRGTWHRVSNETAWSAFIGPSGVIGPDGYASASVAADLRGLPEAFIDVGSAEIFRDEDVAYATALWNNGVQAELHVWPGGFHSFEGLVPQASMSISARARRRDWFMRLCAPAVGPAGPPGPA